LGKQLFPKVLWNPKGRLLLENSLALGKRIREGFFPKKKEGLEEGEETFHTT